MKKSTNQILEFDIILNRLSNMAVSQCAKEKALAIKPFMGERECRLRMEETAQATEIVKKIGVPPVNSMQSLNLIIELTKKGAMLLPEQFNAIVSFLISCSRMVEYLKKAQYFDSKIAFYGDTLDTIPELREEINRCITNNAVDSNATSSLRDVRRKIEALNIAIKEKLESILRGRRECFADGYVTTRNGHFVLPVKKEYKNQVAGAVIDHSGTGGTVFIEPASVKRYQETLNALVVTEDCEINKILYVLTSFVEEHLSVLQRNIECMETLDFIFAKAKLAVDMNGIAVPISANRQIKIVQGRHPLLPQGTCVPIDFQIGGDVCGIIITGPNTGGKTVALKTVGLLSLMAQSGLLVPVERGSVFGMQDCVLCDIGDGQSITENLSTFSAHIIAVMDILKTVSSESLVLLDELGSGTDPAEGMGLAIAIIEELNKSNCLFVATTHYPEIKEYARNTQGLLNARMHFDRVSLKPLYKLEIGEAGESCALYIAKRLGLPSHMLALAHRKAYGKDLPANDFFDDESESLMKDNTFKSNVLQKEKQIKEASSLQDKFKMGDSVTVSPDNEIGIVYRGIDSFGNMIVQIKGEKLSFNHKRVKLLTSAAELYPDDYDFDIIFETVGNRKARHMMAKKHDSDISIEY